MLSYMLASPQSSTSEQKVGEELLRARRAMTHMPARSSTRIPRNVGTLMTSKAFNPVANRPNSTIRAPPAQIQVAMSYVTSAWKTTSTTVPTYASEAFIVNAFAAASAYLAVFDQYRIDEIEIWIEPIISQSSAIALVSNYCTAVDVDDSNVPVSFTDVVDHQSAIVTNGEGGHYHKFKPHMAVALYSGVFTSFGNEPSNWIDSASPSVQHYGLKFANTSATSTAMIYSLTVKAKVSFRNPGI